MPRHDDLGRAEQRGRGARATRLRARRTASTSSTPRRCIRCRPTRDTQGRTEPSSAPGSRASARDELVVASKVAGPGRRDWIRNGRTDLTRDVIAEAFDTSLARLRTDYIDLFQIHWPQRNVPMFGATEFDPAKERDGPVDPEQVEGMAALIEAGKIRHYGLSNETSWGVCEFHRVARELGVPGPVTTQNSYSLVSRGVDNDLAEVLFREKMSLLAYSPLGRWHAYGQISRRRDAADARFALFDDFGMRFRKPIVLEAVARTPRRAAARADAGAARAGLRQEPLVRRRHRSLARRRWRNSRRTSRPRK